VLPQTAVLNDAAGEFVYVLGAGDKAERRAVTVGGAREDGVIVALAESDIPQLTAEQVRTVIESNRR